MSSWTILSTDFSFFKLFVCVCVFDCLFHAVLPSLCSFTFGQSFDMSFASLSYTCFRFYTHLCAPNRFYVKFFSSPLIRSHYNFSILFFFSGSSLFRPYNFSSLMFSEKFVIQRPITTYKFSKHYTLNVLTQAQRHRSIHTETR